MYREWERVCAERNITKRAFTSTHLFLSMLRYVHVPNKNQYRLQTVPIVICHSAKLVECIDKIIPFPLFSNHKNV